MEEDRMQLERLARRGRDTRRKARGAAAGSRSNKGPVALMVAAIYGMAAGPVAADTFTAIKLGHLGGGASAADGIGPSSATATALIVGNSKKTADEIHAFVWNDANGNGAVDAGELKDLGAIVEGGSSYATAVNKNGHIVGYAEVAPGGGDEGGGGGGGGDEGGGDGGDGGGGDGGDGGDGGGGEVAGDPLNTHAILWKPAGGGAYTAVDLGTLKTGDAGTSRALAINASGQIVGWSETNTADQIHACLWQDKNNDGDYDDAGEKVDLGTLVDLNAGDSQANGINDDGLIVGWSQIAAGGARHACLWQDKNGNGSFGDSGEKMDLGTLAAADAGASEAYAINASGGIVGWSEISAGGLKRAFLYAGGAMIDLGTLGGNNSEAYGINSLGQVVGKAQNAAGAYTAFLYSDGAVYDLNILSTTLPANTLLGAATSVNDALQITGDATDSSGDDPVDVAFRVTPDGAIDKIEMKSPSVKGGKALAGTVTLGAPAPTGGARVNLTSNNAAALVPASVTVPEGKTTANFGVTTAPVSANATVTLTASRGLAKTATFTLAAAAVSKVAIKPSSVAGGASTVGTVSLDGAAPVGGATVTLTSNDEESATVPETVTVPAGKSSATFTVDTAVVSTAKTVTISAVIGAGTPATATLAVTTALVSSVTIAPASVAGGQLAVGTVTLSGAAKSGGQEVTLTSSDTATATVPATVTVAAGKTSATFAVKTKLVTTDAAITIEGKTGDSDKKTGKLKVTAPALAGLALTQSSVTGGEALKGVVTLTGRSASDTTVTLAASVTAASPGASVVVKAGATSATFSITTTSVDKDTKVTLKATLGKVSKSAALTVKKS
jgi:probable HAF family extracellular repeat protein